MENIQETLRPFGVGSRYKGYKYTVYAIYLSVTDEHRMEAVTKEIYMETATHFGCKWAAVERDIRTVVAKAWNTDPGLLCQMAGYSLTVTPTASEFIEIVSVYILRSGQ